MAIDDGSSSMVPRMKIFDEQFMGERTLDHVARLKKYKMMIINTISVSSTCRKLHWRTRGLRPSW